MEKDELDIRMKRFNEIEDEIERLQTMAEKQADNYINAYNGEENVAKTNTNVAILVGIIVVAILSVLSTALGIISAILLLGFIYLISSNARGLKLGTNKTLSRIDELRHEQKDLDL
jgi:hypothetical protein